MKSIILPPDIKRHIRKKMIAYLIKLFLWESAVIAANIAVWNRFERPVIHAIITVVSIILPFLFIGLPKNFLHSTVVGTVTEVHIREETDSYRVGLRYWPYIKHVILLDIVTDEGRIRRVKAREYGQRSFEGFAVPFEGDIQLHLNDYAIGDTVYRFRGLALPFVVTHTRRNTNDCIVCGSENPSNQCNCYYCGHTILKIDIEND